MSKHKKRKNLRRRYCNLFVRIIILLSIGYLLLTQVFLLTRATGNGMFPAVKDGDLIFAYRLAEDYIKNDVVLYQQGESLAFGRIVAQENDIVDFTEDGFLLVNGTTEYGEILYPTQAKAELSYPYSVPSGAVFILGDYRTQTKDSRDYGAVALDHIEGKVLAFLRRRGI